MPGDEIPSSALFLPFPQQHTCQTSSRHAVYHCHLRPCGYTVRCRCSSSTYVAYFRPSSNDVTDDEFTDAPSTVTEGWGTRKLVRQVGGWGPSMEVPKAQTTAIGGWGPRAEAAQTTAIGGWGPREEAGATVTGGWGARHEARQIGGWGPEAVDGHTHTTTAIGGWGP